MNCDDNRYRQKNIYHRLIRDKHADLLFVDNWENLIIIIMKTKYEITGMIFSQLARRSN